jgi:hypothetical protein
MQQLMYSNGYEEGTIENMEFFSSSQLAVDPNTRTVFPYNWSPQGYELFWKIINVNFMNNMTPRITCPVNSVERAIDTDNEDG